MRVLKRYIQIRQDQPLGHERDQIAHMRVGIDIMQPHPSAQRSQIARQISNMGAVAARFGVFDIHPVGAGVLRDDQKLFYPIFNQFFRLAQHRMGRTAGQTAAHIGDDAKFALVVAAFGNLEIAVMPRGQFDASCGQKINERIRAGRRGAVHRIEHLLILLWAGDSQNTRMRAGDIIGLGPETAGDDDLAIFLQSFADRLKAFGFGAVEKSAGVYNYRIGAAVIR